LVDKVLAVDKYRQKYLEYLLEFIRPCNKHFPYSEFKTCYDTALVLYAGKDVNDTINSVRIKLAGFEDDYFHQKTMNVLDQLKLGYEDFEEK
jgi:hypothetical protein